MYGDNRKMETAIVYWGYIGIMENKMQTIIMAWTITYIIPLHPLDQFIRIYLQTHFETVGPT